MRRKLFKRLDNIETRRKYIEMGAPCLIESVPFNFQILSIVKTITKNFSLLYQVLEVSSMYLHVFLSESQFSKWYDNLFSRRKILLLRREGKEMLERKKLNLRYNIKRDKKNICVCKFLTFLHI